MDWLISWPMSKLSAVFQWLHEVVTDDVTKRGSASRIALLSAALVLEWGLVFALRRYDATGREGWASIINTLCLCLAGIFSSYLVKVASPIWTKLNPKDGQNGQ